MRFSVILFIAMVQGAFFVLLVLLLFVNNARRALRARRATAAADRVHEPLQRWLLGTAHAADVANVLRRLPERDALDQLTFHIAPRVPQERLAHLSRALCEDRWVRRILGQATSRLWWRRLDAARLLAVVGSVRDRGLVRQLLSDDHAAVQAAASLSLTRIGDLALVEHVLDTLHARPPIVRVFQLRILRETWKHTVPALLERLQPLAPLAKLQVWIALAETLADSRCLAAVIGLRTHPNSEVRISTARALRRYMHPDAVSTLREMLHDSDWRVCAQAARGLGAVSAANAVGDLSDALIHRSWWVRFRSALALAQLGEAGRRALRSARERKDRYATDMAAMVSGLSDGAVVELAEA
jgi:HEAT repeat protein